MKTLLVIFRSHSGPNVHAGGRVFEGPKEELIVGCLRSLLRSMRGVDRTRYDVRFAILDDHSEEMCVRRMRDLAARESMVTTFVPLSARGVGPSFGASYAYARDNPSDLIYFVEDDYLHAPSALAEMLEAQEFFSQKLGGTEVAIFPVDYPDKYAPEAMKVSYLLLGPKRHWYLDRSTTGTFLISRTAYLANIDLCMKMGLFRVDPIIHEGNSLNLIWTERGVQLFSPVPTLTIHMQSADLMPPYIDWQSWWKQYAS